jgi:hypothetical protein
MLLYMRGFPMGGFFVEVGLRFAHSKVHPLCLQLIDPGGNA